MNALTQTPRSRHPQDAGIHQHDDHAQKPLRFRIHLHTLGSTSFRTINSSGKHTDIDSLDRSF